jgi:hypothetical protein
MKLVYTNPQNYTLQAVIVFASGRNRDSRLQGSERELRFWQNQRITALSYKARRIKNSSSSDK